MYGIGRGRAIGHLLKGALPDPNWLPASAALISSQEQQDDLDHSDFNSNQQVGSDTMRSDPDLASMLSRSRPPARFSSGDRITNKSGSRTGVVVDEPSCWIEATRLTTGELCRGYWSYAVAWDGQMGMTIRYAEDLLRPAGSDQTAKDGQNNH